MRKNLLSVILPALILTSALSRPGDGLCDIELLDIDKKRCWLIDNSTVPVVVFYDTYGSLSINREFLNMISAMALEKRIKLCRVVDMSGTWYIPDSLIYISMKDEVQKDRAAFYFFDEEENLAIKWRIKSSYSGSAVFILDSRGALVHEIYGRMEIKQAAVYSKFLELIH